MSKKSEPLSAMESRFLHIISKHRGLDNAISGRELSEELNTKPRMVRTIFNHLLMDHLMLLASSDKPNNYGYFLPETKEEIENFQQNFRKRGLTALTKSAKIKKVSLLYESTQITFEQYKNDEKIPGIVESFQAYLKIFQKNPKLYAQEIKALSDDTTPIFMDAKRIKQINEAARAQEESARRLIELTSQRL